MKKILLYFIITQFLFCQIPSTIPRNVFRFSVSKSFSNANWNIKNNQFSLRGIGKKYFDYETHNDSLRFSSNFDLYHNGSMNIDSSNTLEEWITNFNSLHSCSLPTFESQNIDTSHIIAPSGIFNEDRIRKININAIKIDYGMSDEVTLSISIPFIESYEVNQLFSNYSVDKIDGAKLLVDYHQNARQDFNNFFDSNKYNNLRNGLKDTLQMIYQMFYTNNGKYSVKWAFHSQDDPINNLLIDESFIPSAINKDSVTISDIVSHYYPEKINGSGLNDIKIGTTFLLNGVQPWKIDGPGDAIYGQISFTIPYGKTLTQYLDSGSKQFSEAKIGDGISRWTVGLLGSRSIQSKNVRRIFFQSNVQFSTTATLNTPVRFFSGGHTHPDSILANIGNTYKYDKGTGFMFNAGVEIEQIPKKMHMVAELLVQYKSKDNYISGDSKWDEWMENYSGNSPTYNKVDLITEFRFLNSNSKYRIGSLPFDCFLGLKNNLASNNTYSGWNLYGGIIAYYQGW